MHAVNKVVFVVFGIALFSVQLFRPFSKKEDREALKRFILITVLYNETNTNRITEYLTCLEKDLHHPLIEHVHIVYDTSKDTRSKKHQILNYLQDKGCTISYVDKRPTYGYCFALANTLYSNRRIILSNADIFFNETLAALETYDLKNKFLALTRWEVRKDGEIVPFNVSYRLISQDTWIFETPLISFEHDSIFIGTNECDSFIAHQAQKAGLTVMNPCLTIQCCHLHLSGVRNYEFHRHSKLPHDYKPAHWTRL
jgi:hypothetical protein